MPSWELFEDQNDEYRQSVRPHEIPKLSIEAGITQGWHKHVAPDGIAMGIDHFGASAPGDILLREVGFTANEVVQRESKMTT